MSAHAKFAVTSVMTVFEVRHLSHVITEPFVHASDLLAGLIAVWSLSDGAFTGWLLLTGAFTATVSVMFANALNLAKFYSLKFRKMFRTSN